MKILVVNCGSSSIKYQLFQMPGRKVLAKGVVERIGEGGSALVYEHDGAPGRQEASIADHQAAMTTILRALTDPKIGVIDNIDRIGAVGHRVVHGGEEFTGSVTINAKVIASIERFSDLAPLHNPPNLTGIRAAQARLPDTLQVACFDTAFHATIPAVAHLYALPYELYTERGVRRYGFHGTSHRWVARRAAAMLGLDKYEINCITCHLGNGCSIAAVKGGRSVDTSMGLTPLEGVVMGTRSGDFDPAIIFYLADKGYDMAALKSLCNKWSGLLGISGISNDMRSLTDKAAQGNERAQLAIDVFCYRIKKYIGAYSAALGHVDAIVFTGGIGENAANVRADVCSNLEQQGIELDPLSNKAEDSAERRISTRESRVNVLVIPTNEEGAIADDTYKIASSEE